MTPEQRLTSRCFAAVVGALMAVHGIHLGWVVLVVVLMLVVDHTAAKA